MTGKILLKLISLILFLVAFNYIYKIFFLERDIQEFSDVINIVRAVPNDADILYIGESSNNTNSGKDIDTRPISAFVGDFFPELKVNDITVPASHAGIFKILLENIPKTSEVQTLLVTLNLRSFNAQWIYSNLETPLQKSVVLLKSYPPLVNRFLLSFKAYDIKTKSERNKQLKAKWKRDRFNLSRDFPHDNVIQWDKWMANTGIKDKNGDINKAQTELACHYIKAYGFQIDTLNNPRIKDFNAIVKLAERRGWNLVFNLMAENTEKADQLVGNDLVSMMDENRKLLIKYYQSRGVLVVDNLFSVEDNQFIDQNWTTEHYAENGRKTIARNVAATLKIYHRDHYKVVDYK